MNHKEIILSNGMMARVDEADFDLVSQYNWHVQRGGARFYAVARIGGKKVSMHRLLLGREAGKLDIDHRNSDGLDNRRENLRVATRSQNLANTHKYISKTATSNFKGVRFRKDCEKYSAQIVVEGKYIHLGLFKQGKEAAHAYDEAARKYFGEFAGINFPEPIAA